MNLQEIEPSPMTVLDIAECAAIERECFSDPWPPKFFESSLERQGSGFFTIRTHDKIIGYGGVYTFMDEAEIVNIAVRPDWRRRGIGRIITQTLITFAENRGAEKIFLEARKSNSGAIALYRSLSFTPVAFRHGYYNNPREDAVIMLRTGERGSADERVSI